MESSTEINTGYWWGEQNLAGYNPMMPVHSSSYTKSRNTIWPLLGNCSLQQLWFQDLTNHLQRRPIIPLGQQRCSQPHLCISAPLSCLPFPSTKHVPSHLPPPGGCLGHTALCPAQWPSSWKRMRTSSSVYLAEIERHRRNWAPPFPEAHRQHRCQKHISKSEGQTSGANSANEGLHLACAMLGVIQPLLTSSLLLCFSEENQGLSMRLGRKKLWKNWEFYKVYIPWRLPVKWGTVLIIVESEIMHFCYVLQQWDHLDPFN